MPALKLIAACVCPIVGSTVAIKTIPAARAVVHRMTADTPRREVVAPPVSSIPAETPCQIVTTPLSVGTMGEMSFAEPVLGDNIGQSLGQSLGRPILSPVVSAPVPPAVPEPQMWAAMTLGFGLVGVAMRKRKVVRHG